MSKHTPGPWYIEQGTTEGSPLEIVADVVVGGESCAMLIARVYDGSLYNDAAKAIVRDHNIAPLGLELAEMVVAANVVDGNLSMCSRELHLTPLSGIGSWFKWGCQIYEAEGREEVAKDTSKILFRSARLLCPVEPPDWIRGAQQFVLDIPQVPFFKPDLKPKPEWKLFTADSGAAAWAAEHARARWEVWQKGYGLLCDVSGVLYVYAKEAE